MKLKIATVDAFTNRIFSGNPAAVCLLEEKLTAFQMQTIAMEMNLSETAFVEKTDDPSSFGLRWFTPTLEIDLCGHATLASAHWMIQSGWAKSGELIRFQTKSGELRVKSDGEWLEMDFPLIPTIAEQHPFFKNQFMGVSILESAKLRRNWIFELPTYQEVEALVPDFELIAAHSEEGIIVTAKGKEPFDIYSRFFGPNVGVPEDPVTGFAHCALMDYWYQKTGKTQLQAYQASKRGGILFLEKRGDRVALRGQAVRVLNGFIEF
jgi:predicted PhzF superfamily epimerase YddE/YHI9